ncbi:MAG: chromate resistance protein [Chromatiaceae bacterium]|nr:chromate resistance protein [Chromatiaceae bacterium]
MSFLALFVTLPTKQSAGRMRVWRALRALGSATLRDGVYLLPDSAAHAQALGSIAEDVKSVAGTADIYCLDGRDDTQRQTLIALFDRKEDYAGLLKAIQAANPAEAKTVRALQREFSALAAIDFFPGEAQRQAEAALAALAAQAAGEPVDAAGRIRRLASAEFQGRVWATRKNPWADRLASAWLIRRHIDPLARFVWLADPSLCPQEALGFDFDGAAFTHVEGRVTFEVLAASFGLTDDPALGRIATIVHFLDVGGVPVAEAPGIEAVLAGARASAVTDDELLSEASRLFDNLFTHYQQEPARDG